MLNHINKCKAIQNNKLYYRLRKIGEYKDSILFIKFLLKLTS
jgi:hypothetical protein